MQRSLLVLVLAASGVLPAYAERHPIDLAIDALKSRYQTDAVRHIGTAQVVRRFGDSAFYCGRVLIDGQLQTYGFQIRDSEDRSGEERVGTVLDPLVPVSDPLLRCKNAVRRVSVSAIVESVADEDIENLDSSMEESNPRRVAQLCMQFLNGRLQQFRSKSSKSPDQNEFHQAFVNFMIESGIDHPSGYRCGYWLAGTRAPGLGYLLETYFQAKYLASEESGEAALTLAHYYGLGFLEGPKEEQAQKWYRLAEGKGVDTSSFR